MVRRRMEDSEDAYRTGVCVASDLDLELDRRMIMNDARVNGEIRTLGSSSFNDVRRINCVHCRTSLNVRESGCNALKTIILTPRDNFVGQAEYSNRKPIIFYKT